MYKLAEQPIPGFGPESRSRSECALDLVAEADQLFDDAGHAIVWTLAQIPATTQE